MNTDGLAKHYNLLTPWERLPLMVAAMARGDDVEYERLGRSAPNRRLRVANYWGLSDGLRNIATSYMLRQLEAAVCLGHAVGLLVPWLRSAKGASKGEERVWKAVQTRAYIFLVRADGWKLFCAELHIDPDDPLRNLPGYSALRETEKTARLVACSPEQALANIREDPERKESAQGASSAVPCEYHIDTPEDVARSMREDLEQLHELWS
jgi:hypothetical protein